jgi:phenylalanyl-tRNA synthetase beta chain
MKISINWMLDHIATPISSIDIGLIVAKFNVHTAEIESYEKFDLDINNLFIGRVVSIDQAGCSVRCDELNQLFQLSARNDLQVGQLALIRRAGSSFAWEKLSHYSPEKEGLFAAVDCHESLLAGGWKQDCETFDYVVDVDNKSINHRPDLWGHRGIAGEVAAFMGWQLKPLASMLMNVGQLDYPTISIPQADQPLTVVINDETICPRVASLYCQDITHKASQIWMAMRLARVASKPINTIVDITNYVMFDISQPMHVFDAANFPAKNITVRTAQSSEQLELLDGHQVALTNQDIVITDGQHPVALAGVMGGKKASFSNAARSIIIESGSFSAAMVRISSARVKIASEAATRFAKQLDPMQNVTALQRFLFLAQGLGVVGSVTNKLVSVGKIITPAIITISHQFITSRLGLEISSAQIIENLEKLQFAVTTEQQDLATIYHVSVPTVRMTKDITIPEDIVEEVARVFGYQNISYVRPVRAMKSFDISPVMKLRSMKQYCAFAMNMREVRDYLFYDESFLKRLGWYPCDAVAIKNPVSENWKVLVTSLIPHLIKNVELNIPSHEQINFFEYNNIWKAVSEKESTPAFAQAMADAGKAAESKSLAGIFFGHKNLNFYDYKAQLQGFFAAQGLPVVWKKPTQALEPWFDQLQTADLMLQGVCIGRAGMLATNLTRSVIKGQGFVFELCADLLLAYKPAEKQFAPWSKYQAVHVDMSLLIDARTTAEQLENLIVQVDPKIESVSLLDFFEKEEWAGKRSLTFRYKICDFEQNLTKEVIDQVTSKVIESMIACGAQIR